MQSLLVAYYIHWIRSIISDKQDSWNCWPISEVALQHCQLKTYLWLYGCCASVITFVLFERHPTLRSAGGSLLNWGLGALLFFILCNAGAMQRLYWAHWPYLIVCCMNMHICSGWPRFSCFIRNTSRFKIPFSVCRGHWWGGCALNREVIQQVLNGAKQIK